MSARHLVVVGGGLSSGRLVARYREEGGEDDVTLVSADTFPPYHRPPLSKRYLRGASAHDRRTRARGRPRRPGRRSRDQRRVARRVGRRGGQRRRGSFDDRQAAPLYARDGVLVGALVLGQPEEVENELKEAIRARRQASALQV